MPAPMLETLWLTMRAARDRQAGTVEAAAARVMTGVGRSVAGVVNGMMLLNLLGATDRAFDLARACYLEQGPVIAAMDWRPGQPAMQDQRWRKTNMLLAPTAAGMQRDPRFVPLMQQMGLADYWKRRGVVPDSLL